MSTEVVITGIGLLSGFGSGASAHWTVLSQQGIVPNVDADRFAPYVVHPLGAVDFAPQIPKKADLRQMETWQRIGVHAAGLALADAGIAGRLEYLATTNLIVAAGSGERDTATDMKVLETIAGREDADVRANEILPSNLRPTLFLAQLSNLLAGNISIVHRVTGSSRTFMGEEMAGFAAVETAFRRIAAGQGSLFLVGGAYNAEREDALLNFELGGMLLKGQLASIWERAQRSTAGFAPASLGAFLVIEERGHAERRGAQAYAQISDVRTGRCNRSAGAATESLRALHARLPSGRNKGPLAILSGASGTEPATSEERAFIEGLLESRPETAIRAYGSLLGHGVEAHFPLGLALAAMALKKGRFYPPFDATGIERELLSAPPEILVTGCGHWRGEALALVTAEEA
ncbi:MAG: beta-ketoacyl-ACP synthase [Hyphomicrobiaceae bacterium]|nr:beta-ketoacyl-ACP synthase [Hyphomicrobiaceae bacterium]